MTMVCRSMVLYILSKSSLIGCDTTLRKQRHGNKASSGIKVPQYINLSQEEQGDSVRERIVALRAGDRKAIGAAQRYTPGGIQPEIRSDLDSNFGEKLSF
jgi:hypothetical protein